MAGLRGEREVLILPKTLVRVVVVVHWQRDGRQSRGNTGILTLT